MYVSGLKGSVLVDSAGTGGWHVGGLADPDLGLKHNEEA